MNVGRFADCHGAFKVAMLGHRRQQPHILFFSISKVFLLSNQPSSSRPCDGNDNQHLSPPSFGNDVIMALRFFSRLPSGNTPHQAPSLARIAPVLGFVGILIGIFPALVLVALAYLGLPELLAAVFAVAALVIITGAMAEDALADSADGLWGGASVARRLEIMKDSRNGTYGVLAIVLLIAARLAILSFLVVQSPLGAGFVWLGAQIIARQGALWLPSVLSPARPDGLAQKAGIISLRTFWLSSAISAVIALILAGPFVGVLALAAGLAVTALIIWGWTRICLWRVGGFSGDLIGALQAMVEIGVLSTFILFI